MTIATDTDALLELVWAAPLAAIAVTVSWALVIWGSTRGFDSRREGRAAHAALHFGVAVIGVTMFTAAVVFGIIVMTAK